MSSPPPGVPLAPSLAPTVRAERRERAALGPARAVPAMGRPRGRLRYWARRFRRNLGIAAVAAAVVAAVLACWAGDPSAVHRASLATGYAGGVLLAWALAIGPWALVRHGRRAPTSTDLRRDVGIWATAFGVAHTVVGLRVHLKGDAVAYFANRADDGAASWPRHDAFGAANYTGLAAALLLLLLTAVSNDRALRALGAARWKRLQRATYVVAAVTAAHGLVYQQLEGRARVGVVVLVALSGAVLGLQLVGRRRYAAGRSHGPAGDAS